MRRIIAIAGSLCLLVLCHNGVFAQVDTVWTANYYNGFFDSVNCVQQTADSGFIMVGMMKPEGEAQTEINLIKADRNGGHEWTRLIGFANYDCGFHVLQTYDGGYFISAHTDAFTSPGDGRIWVIKTDAAGDTVWTYGVTSHGGSAFPLYAVETSDSGFAVTGIMNTSGSNQAFILRLDKDGGYQWVKDYGNDRHQRAEFIGQMPDGGFIVAGQFDNTYSTGYDFWAFRTNLAGVMIWDSIYALTDYADIMNGACMVNDGLVMVGTARGEGHALKIDFDGNTIWSKSISIAPYDENYCTVCPASNNGAVVGGWHGVVGKGREFCYIRLNASGDTLWSSTVGGPNNDHGRSITPTYDGGYALAGTSSSFYSGTCVYLTKIMGPPELIIGDANGDGGISVGDAVYILAYIFHGGPAPDPLCIADVNGDGSVDIGDAVYLLQYIFVHGPELIDNC